MDKSIWEKAIGENADKEGVEPCNRYKERVCTKEEEGVSIVKGGEIRGKRVCKRTVKEGIYSAVEITTNSVSILCREERWGKNDGAGLQILKRVDNQEQLPTPFNIRCLGKYWNKKDFYEDGLEVGL